MSQKLQAVQSGFLAPQKYIGDMNDREKSSKLYAKKRNSKLHLNSQKKKIEEKNGISTLLSRRFMNSNFIPNETYYDVSKDIVPTFSQYM